MSSDDRPAYAMPPRAPSTQSVPTPEPEKFAGWTIKDGELVDAATGERPPPLPSDAKGGDALWRLARHLPPDEAAAMQRTLFAVQDHLETKREPALADLAARGADLPALVQLACADNTQSREQPVSYTHLTLPTICSV